MTKLCQFLVSCSWVTELLQDLRYPLLPTSFTEEKSILALLTSF